MKQEITLRHGTSAQILYKDGTEKEVSASDSGEKDF